MAVTEKDDRLSFCLEAFSRLVRTRQLPVLGKGKSVCIVALKQCPVWDTQASLGTVLPLSAVYLLVPEWGRVGISFLNWCESPLRGPLLGTVLGVRAGAEVQLEQKDRQASTAARCREGAPALRGQKGLQLRGGAAGHPGQAGQPPSAALTPALSSAPGNEGFAEEGPWGQQPAAAAASTLDKLCPLRYGGLRCGCACFIFASSGPSTW